MQRSILFTLLAAALAGPVLAAPVTLGLGNFTVANTGTLVGDPILLGSAVPEPATAALVLAALAALAGVAGMRWRRQPAG